MKCYSLLPYKLYFLFSLKCHFLSFFSFFFFIFFYFLFITFNSLFRLHWLVHCFFHIHGYCSYLYHNSIHVIFPFFPYFHQPFCLLKAFIHSTYFPLSFDRVQLDTIPPRSFNLCLTTKDPPILDRGQSAEKPPPLYLPKMAKTPINSLSSLSSMLQMVPTYLSSHFW